MVIVLIRNTTIRFLESLEKFLNSRRHRRKFGVQERLHCLKLGEDGGGSVGVAVRSDDPSSREAVGVGLPVGLEGIGRVYGSVNEDAGAGPVHLVLGGSSVGVQGLPWRERDAGKEVLLVQGHGSKRRVRVVRLLQFIRQTTHLRDGVGKPLSPKQLQKRAPCFYTG